MYIYIYVCMYIHNATRNEGYRAGKNNNFPTSFGRGLFQGNF